ncbi:MAG TPA: alpha/beta hydrolase [Allosphingosinicella sp.]|nr:alpha/beta hydrolase [Allosphingosinicella sp.]
MRIGRRDLLLGTLAAGLAGRAPAQAPVPSAPDAEIDLWPAGAPGMPAIRPPEAVRERSTDPGYNDRILTDIARPRLAVFRPARPNGAAVLIMPGGGYGWVVIDKEGHEMARLLSARGIAAFVLFYRLPHQGWAAGPDVPLADARRAMALVRAARGVDPRRICAMGFSAGGHVCASLLARFGDGSARPDAAALVYPVISMSAPNAHAGSRRHLIGERATPALERAYSPHLHVPADAPPTFLLHAEDDASVPVANTLLMRDALGARGTATETHLFPDGGHGFGLRLARGSSVERWPDLFLAWGRHRRLWP